MCACSKLFISTNVFVSSTYLQLGHDDDGDAKKKDHEIRYLGGYLVVVTDTMIHFHVVPLCMCMCVCLCMIICVFVLCVCV